MAGAIDVYATDVGMDYLTQLTMARFALQESPTVEAGTYRMQPEELGSPTLVEPRATTESRVAQEWVNQVGLGEQRQTRLDEASVGISPGEVAVYEPPVETGGSQGLEPPTIPGLTMGLTDPLTGLTGALATGASIYEILDIMGEVTGWWELPGIADIFQGGIGGEQVGVQGGAPLETMTPPGQIDFPGGDNMPGAMTVPEASITGGTPQIGAPEPLPGTVMKQWVTLVHSNTIGNYYIYFYKLTNGYTVCYNPAKREWKKWKPKKHIILPRGKTTLSQAVKAQSYLDRMWKKVAKRTKAVKLSR